MANTAIEIPFYVSKDGQALTGGAAEMNFESLKLLDGTDKSGSAPSVSEIGGGWYKFSVAYGTAPFNAGDIVGVIDTDKDGTNNVLDVDRYIPVEVRLDFYALARLVNKMTQDKLTGDMAIKDSSNNTVLELGITDSQSTLERTPGVVS